MVNNDFVISAKEVAESETLAGTGTAWKTRYLEWFLWTQQLRLQQESDRKQSRFEREV